MCGQVASLIKTNIQILSRPH